VRQASNSEKELTNLRKSLAGVQEQLSASQAERDTASNEAAQAKQELQALKKQAKKLQQENDHLELENNDLVAKVTEHANNSTALAIVKDENTVLRAAIKTLKEEQKSGTGDSKSQQDIKMLEDKLHTSEANSKNFERGIAEWKGLATVSLYLKRSSCSVTPNSRGSTVLICDFTNTFPQKTFEEYQRFKLAAREIDIFRQENEKLKASLAQSGAGGTTNGAGDDGTNHVAYWRTKYNDLLASTTE
jgi:regulator of replication initiation timing